MIQVEDGGLEEINLPPGPITRSRSKRLKETIQGMLDREFEKDTWNTGWTNREVSNDNTRPINLLECVENTINKAQLCF